MKPVKVRLESPEAMTLKACVREIAHLSQRVHTLEGAAKVVAPLSHFEIMFRIQTGLTLPK